VKWKTFTAALMSTAMDIGASRRTPEKEAHIKRISTSTCMTAHIMANPALERPHCEGELWSS